MYQNKMNLLGESGCS